MAGEEVTLLLMAVMPQMLKMAVMMLMQADAGAGTAAVSAAGGRIAGGRKRSSDECDDGDRANEDCSPCSHGMQRSDERSERKGTRPGEIRPGGSFIAICLHVPVRHVADVDVADQHRAPHPARPAADVETPMAVVVAVVVVTVVVVMVAVVMTMAMAVAMTAATGASRRVTRGGEGRNGQRDGGSSGSEDSTLHQTSPGV